MTLSGAVTGANSLTKVGSGTLWLSLGKSITYTGATTIKAGELLINFPNDSSTTAYNNTTFYVGDTGGSTSAALQFGYQINQTVNPATIIVQSGNTGTAYVDGSGYLYLYGTITLGTSNSSGHGVTIGNANSTGGWTYGVFSTIQDPAGLTPGTAGTVTVGFNGDGGGTVVFDGANTYTGNTRAAYGPFTVANANALQNSTLDMNAADSGTLTFNQNSTLGGLTGSRTWA